jgi:hypothetical protein
VTATDIAIDIAIADERLPMGSVVSWDTWGQPEPPA